MKKITSLGLASLLLGAVSAVSLAQIKHFTLEEMVQTADQAVYGQIIGSRVLRVIDPADGGEHFFTRITVQGKTLSDAQPTTVDITFRGGFLNETEGVFNSEAPAADDVKVGRRVVAFYRWADDLGGGLAANALVAAHGGLYRTAEGPRGPAVLGRGEGYAISSNRKVEQLETSVRLLAAAKHEKR